MFIILFEPLCFRFLEMEARGPRSIPSRGDKISVSIHAPLTSFSGMNVTKCTVLIGTLTGGPLCRKNHPLCRLKITTIITWLLCRLSSCISGVYVIYTCEKWSHVSNVKYSAILNHSSPLLKNSTQFQLDYCEHVWVNNIFYQNDHN